jgi:hypothetical protein
MMFVQVDRAIVPRVEQSGERRRDALRTLLSTQTDAEPDDHRVAMETHMALPKADWLAYGQERQTVEDLHESSGPWS